MYSRHGSISYLSDLVQPENKRNNMEQKKNKEAGKLGHFWLDLWKLWYIMLSME